MYKPLLKPRSSDFGLGQHFMKFSGTTAIQDDGLITMYHRPILHTKTSIVCGGLVERLLDSSIIINRESINGHWLSKLCHHITLRLHVSLKYV